MIQYSLYWVVVRSCQALSAPGSFVYWIRSPARLQLCTAFQGRRFGQLWYLIRLLLLASAFLVCLLCPALLYCAAAFCDLRRCRIVCVVARAACRAADQPRRVLKRATALHRVAAGVSLPIAVLPLRCRRCRDLPTAAKVAPRSAPQRHRVCAAAGLLVSIAARSA